MGMVTSGDENEKSPTALSYNSKTVEDFEYVYLNQI